MKTQTNKRMEMQILHSFGFLFVLRDCSYRYNNFVFMCSQTHYDDVVRAGRCFIPISFVLSLHRWRQLCTLGPNDWSVLDSIQSATSLQMAIAAMCLPQRHLGKYRPFRGTSRIPFLFLGIGDDGPRAAVGMGWGNDSHIRLMHICEILSYKCTRI